MSKWLKVVLGAVAALLLVLVLAIIALPFVIDPNSFKGPLERVAAEQNVHLELEGPISWTFFPQLGLSLEKVSIASPEAKEQAVIQAAAGTAAVAVKPLLTGKVRVKEFSLDGVAINLVVDENGRGNWETLGPQGEQDAEPLTEETPEQAPSEGEARELDVAVEHIAITNASLRYEDRQSDQVVELSDLAIRLTDVNLESRAFPLTVAARLALSDLPNPLHIEFSSQLEANGTLDRFALADGQLRLNVGDDRNARIQVDVTGSANLQDALAYEGQLALRPFNPKALLSALGQELPEMADPTALSNVAFTLAVAGSDTELHSESLELVLDETRLAGSLQAQLPEPGLPTLALNLSGNRIDVDRYLAPSSDEETAPEEEEAAGETEPSPLPLEDLRSFNANIQLAMDEIVVSAMPITQARLKITGNQGLWKLEELSANFYQGKLLSQAELDARSDTANLNFSAGLEGLAVQPLLQDFAEFGDLSGEINGQVEAQTRARMTDELMENLSAAFVFTSPQLTFEGFNAEYFYCQMATQIGDTPMPDTEWPSRTRITDVEGQITFDELRLNVDGVMANIENLVLAITGFLDLNSQEYRVRMPMRLAQERTSPSGCEVKSNFLLAREVDILGCSGSLEDMNLARQCGLDSGAVTSLAGEALRYNAEKRIEKEREELREDLEKKLRERLGSGDENNGEESGSRSKDLLRNLLRR